MTRRNGRERAETHEEFELERLGEDGRLLEGALDDARATEKVVDLFLVAAHDRDALAGVEEPHRERAADEISIPLRCARISCNFMANSSGRKFRLPQQLQVLRGPALGIDRDIEIRENVLGDARSYPSTRRYSRLCLCATFPTGWHYR